MQNWFFYELQIHIDATFTYNLSPVQFPNIFFLAQMATLPRQMYLVSLSIGKNHNYDIGQVSYNIIEILYDLTGDGILSYFVITSF